MRSEHLQCYRSLRGTETITHEDGTVMTMPRYHDITEVGTPSSFKRIDHTAGTEQEFSHADN